MSTLSIALIIIGVLLVCIFLNVPLAFSLFISALVLVLIDGTIPLSFVTQTLFGSTDSFPLLAIPFFILAGDLMSSGGIARKLVEFLNGMFDSIKGSLGIITIFASLIFAAISGSGAATVVAIGGIMIPYMIKNGYAPSYAASLSASAGALGPIIPPSIVFILYGVMANVSISELFIAGILPGFVIAIALVVVNYLVVKKEKFSEVAKESTSDKPSFWKGLNGAKYSLFAPVLILGGIYGGIVTPTEAAVLAAVYSLIIGVFVHKEIKIKELPEVFMKSALTSGTILIFIGTASFFGRVLSMKQIPQLIADSITGITDNPIFVLLLINIFLLIVGMFMETIAAVVIFVPLLLPIILQVGIDPVHFGVIMSVNLSLGLVTPPLGMNLFIASKVANIPFEKTFKYIFTIIGALLIVLLIISYVPQLSLFLPQLMK